MPRIPGCFATTMLLGIVPLVACRDLHGYVLCQRGHRQHRRRAYAPGYDASSVRQSNLFAYQPLKHRHDPEVRALTRAATGVDVKLRFVPHSGPFARGIHATILAQKGGQFGVRWMPRRRCVVSIEIRASSAFNPSRRA
jgi:N-acetyl-gamma-glutamylphosphate reductase